MAKNTYIRHTVTNTYIVNNNSTVIDQLDQLHTQQLEWDQKYFQPQQKHLLDLLATCLDVCHQLQGDRKLHKQFNAAASAANVVFNNGTDVTTKVVRYVFRINTRRAFAYSAALRAAIKAKITVEQFPGWVLECGGVDDAARMRARAGNDRLPPQQVVSAVAEQLMSLPALVSLGKEPKGVEVACNGDTDLAVALIRKNDATGEYEIVFSAKEAGLVASVLKGVAKDVRAEVKNRAAQAAAADQQVRQHDAIKQAAASAAVSVEHDIAMLMAA
jgi:hypothetical protein